jgi:hypothetical protein
VPPVRQRSLRPRRHPRPRATLLQFQSL